MMIFSKRFFSLIFPVIVAFSVANCSGIKLQSPTPTPIETGIDGPTMALIASARAGLLELMILSGKRLNQTVLESPTFANSFIRAQGVLRGQPQFVEADLQTLSVTCPESGKTSFGGKIDVVVDEIEVDLSGPFTQTLTDCSVNATYVSRDGTCSLGGIFVGDVDVDYEFNLQTATGSELLVNKWISNGPLDWTFGDTLYKIEFDLTYTTTADESQKILQGTIIIDGQSFTIDDLAPESFTSEQMGCGA